MSNQNIHFDPKQMKAKYLFAFFSILVSMMIGLTAAIYENQKQNNYSSIINVSGRQRMLSQRLAFYSNRLVNSPKQADISLYKEKLQSGIELFKSSHHALINGSKEFNIKSLEPNLTKSIYFNQDQLNNAFTSYITHLENVLHNFETQPKFAKSENEIIEKSIDSILTKLNQAVLKFEDLSQEQTTRAHLVMILAASMIMLVILFEGKFIFIPMVDTIQKTFDDLLKQKNEIEKLSQVKSNFLSNISHEIRTPLNGIVGAIQLFDKTNTTEMQNQYLAYMQEGADDLVSIIEDILTYSELKTGEVEIKNEKFDLYKLADEINFIFSQKESSNKMRVDLDPSLPRYFLGDARRIKQILFALCSNAYKFTENGLIEVKFSSKEKTDKFHHISILVKDNGIGVSPEKVKDIFRELVQDNDSRTRKFGGLGIGLGTVKTLTDLIGGEIVFESQQGVGTSVKVEFQLVATSNQMENIGRNHVSNLKGLNILVVEDNKMNQVIAKKLLESSGAKVVVADNGHHALDILSHKIFDLILMDVQMPIMDGLEATKEILKLNLSSHPDIVGLSANSNQEDEQKAYDVGMDAFLAKPFKIEELEVVVSELRSKWRLKDVS